MTLGSDGSLLLKGLSENTFTVNGGASVGKDLHVDGAFESKGASFAGDASIARALSVGQGISVEAGNLVVQKGGAVISGSDGLVVDGGDISAKGKVDAGGDISTEGAIHAKGSAEIKGSFRILSDKSDAVAIPSGGLTVAKAITATEGDLDIKKGGARIAGNVDLGGGLKCKGVNIGGKLVIDDASDDSATFAGGLVVKKSISLEGNLKVGAGASIIGDLDVGGKVNVAGDAALRALNVEGTSQLNGGVTIKGDMLLSGRIMLSSDDGASMDVWEAVKALRALVEEKAKVAESFEQKLEESEKKWSQIVEKLETRVRSLEGKLGSAA